MARSNTVAAPFILPVCCLCQQVPDEGRPGEPGWISLEAYVDRYHLGPLDYRLSHTYCPSCFAEQAKAWDLPSVAPPASRRPVRRLRPAR